jgi:hypothetical protein
MLTRLLPIKIVLSILPGDSRMDRRRLALLFPSSASVLSLILLTQVIAVSAEEKKADNNNRITKIINCIPSAVSKTKINSNHIFYVLSYVIRKDTIKCFSLSSKSAVRRNIARKNQSGKRKENEEEWHAAAVIGTGKCGWKNHGSGSYAGICLCIDGSIVNGTFVFALPV